MTQDLARMLAQLSPAQVNWLLIGAGLLAFAGLVLLLDLFLWLFRRHQVILIFALLLAAMILFILALTPLPDLIWWLYRDLIHWIEAARS